MACEDLSRCSDNDETSLRRIWLQKASHRPNCTKLGPAELLAALLSLPITDTIASCAGQLVYDAACNSTQLSFPDALIAATALEHNLTLVTANARHFPVAELKVQEFGTT